MSSSPAAGPAAVTHSPGSTRDRGLRPSKAGTNGSGAKTRKGLANNSSSNGPSPDNSGGSDEELESIMPTGVDIGCLDSGRKTRSSSNTPTNGPTPTLGKRTGRRENSTHSNHSSGGSRESSSVHGGTQQQHQPRTRSRSRSGNKPSAATSEIDSLLVEAESMQEDQEGNVKTNGERSEDSNANLEETAATPVHTPQRVTSLEENGSSKEDDKLENSFKNCTNSQNTNGPTTTTKGLDKSNDINKVRGKRKSEAVGSGDNSESDNKEGKQGGSEEKPKCPVENSAVENMEVDISIPECCVSIAKLESENESQSAKLNGPTEPPRKRGRPRRKAIKNGDNLTDNDKPRDFDEFKQQVKTNLRVEDGRHAEAIDDRSIKCICKKIIRTCSRFNWNYLVQKPKVRNGVVYQKGHWFSCPDVTKAVSCIKPLEETEDPKEDKNEHSKENSKLPSDLIGRLSSRRISKRVPGDKEQEHSSKRTRTANYSEIDEDADDDNTDDESEQGDDEDEDSSEEEEEEEDNFSLYKNISTLLESRIPGEVFLQDGPCFQMAHDSMVMCHVCKYMPKAERRDMLRRGNFDDPECEISCCFYSFRKLKYMKSGNMTVVGYLDPERDVKDSNASSHPKGTNLKNKTDSIISSASSSPSSSSSHLAPKVVQASSTSVSSSVTAPTITESKNLVDDMALWRVDATTTHSDESEDVEKSKFILGLIGDQFCDMVLQEQKCLTLNKEQAENKQVVWKKAVKGVREMCDVCKTTLFNHHWICGRCGIYICLDCYKFRLGGLVKDQAPLDTSFTDEYNWPLCTNGDEHKIEKLLMAQIIPKSALVDLANQMHEVREKWNISQYCHRPKEFSKALTGDGLQQSRVSYNADY